MRRVAAACSCVSGRRVSSKEDMRRVQAHSRAVAAPVVNPPAFARSGVLDLELTPRDGPRTGRERAKFSR